MLGGVRIFNPKMTAKNSSPADGFTAPYKTPTDLLLFDPQASLFQRVRMSGQIVHVDKEVCFMMAGTNGVRFVANTPGALRVGDRVDVAGYPQLGGASPLLREAVVRKTGHATLPEARRLSPGNLASAKCDSTHVRVEGVLTGVREAGVETVLEMQEGAELRCAIERRTRVSTITPCRLSSRIDRRLCRSGWQSSLGPSDLLF